MSEHLSDAYINNLTDYLHSMTTSTSPSLSTTTTATATTTTTQGYQSTSTSYTLLTDDTPTWRSIDYVHNDIYDQQHQQQQHHTKGLEEISLDAFARSQQHTDLYGYDGFLTSDELPITTTTTAELETETTAPTTTTTSTQHIQIPSFEHQLSTSSISPHSPATPLSRIPPSFEQQHHLSISATSHTLPPSSPSLSSDSSSSSTLSHSYSTNELPYVHDTLMRNDSCLSVQQEHSQTRRDCDEIDSLNEDDESNTSASDMTMPDPDSDELPPPGVYPRLCRQNGIYRTRSIAGY